MDSLIHGRVVDKKAKLDFFYRPVKSQLANSILKIREDGHKCEACMSVGDVLHASLEDEGK